MFFNNQSILLLLYTFCIFLFGCFIRYLEYSDFFLCYNCQEVDSPETLFDYIVGKLKLFRLNTILLSNNFKSVAVQLVLLWLEDSQRIKKLEFYYWKRAIMEIAFLTYLHLDYCCNKRLLIGNIHLYRKNEVVYLCIIM